MTSIKFCHAHPKWSDVCFPERTKQGETYTSSGICHDGKSPAFCALQDCKSAESFSRSIALCCPCFAQALGDHPGSPVERMRSTHGRIYSGPENK
jgi:hypothetical protein